MDAVSIAAIGTIVTGVSTAVFGYLGVRRARRGREVESGLAERDQLRRFTDALLVYVYEIRRYLLAQDVEIPEHLRNVPPDPRAPGPREEVTRIDRTRE